MSSTGLTVFAAPATCKQAEAYPVEYCYELRKVLQWCLAHHVAGLGVKGMKHLMRIWLALGLW